MFEAAEYIGIIAFTMSGFFVAVRSRLDLLGVLVSVFLTAFGGGIIRDIIVDRTPYTFIHAAPGFMVLGMMALMIVLQFHRRESIENRLLFILSDSIGLISFSITGALVAMENGLNLTGVLALAFVTAVGGGITRDVIINEVPFVFKTGFYGTIALLVAIVLYGMEQLGWVNLYTTSLLFVAGVVLRIVAYQKKWSIPLR
ncbi:trimeric intracellular cation channel family protein [Sulfurovum mangrovi]|uniref:trimeric intracellular cation channel family protein n=1 Tax=Sulfurovum mangrovi TaxID=2893889 RepID=UPI001E5990C3|nr:TRIC cation channel family protein [Sulfurovum mangrovi]UFH60106.1 TRIC cation channel family protein [Sulfurovum mangrovi]